MKLAHEIDEPRRLGIIDIGSNSIRMVIYQGSGPYPFPVFNERVTCRLGAGLDETGILAAENIAMTLSALSRFAAILKAVKTSKMVIVATAAARRARNADEFLHQAEAILGRPISVLPPSEEARLMTLSLTANMADITGLVADLGGGSLELAQVQNGKLVNSISLNFGHLSTISQTDMINEMANIAWLADCRGAILYGIGGSFRAIGAAYIKQKKYPLSVLHGLVISHRKLEKILTGLTASEPDYSGVPADRRQTIGTAARIISVLTSQIEAPALFVSGTSVRDGLVADLQKKMSPQDNPLIHTARAFATQNSVRTPIEDALVRFLAPLRDHYAKKISSSLIHGAVILSDISANEHPDMQGIIAADRIIALPVFSLSHADRLLLAKMIYHRYIGVKKYKTHANMPHVQAFEELLSKSQSKASTAIGLAIRFARLYCAAIPEYLDEISLSISDEAIICHYSQSAEAIMDTHSRRRFELLAQAMGREAVFQINA